ncbi:MAG: DUF2784 domain-containing protein [Leptospirillia bacterium]
MTSLYAWMADIVAVLHLGFVLFVVLGGILAFRWRRLPMVHLPAVLWAVLLEVFNWPCPLTPLENILRQLAGEAAYDNVFVAHYLLPLIYPGELTRPIQWGLAAFVLVLNAIVYGCLLRRGWRLRGG